MVKKNSSPEEINLELVKGIRELSKEVKNLKELEFMKVFKHPAKFMFFSFLKGIMIGFGSVLGASIVVAIFVYLMAQISVVPIVGDFVEKIMEEISEGGQNGSGESGIYLKYKAAQEDMNNTN